MIICHSRGKACPLEKGGESSIYHSESLCLTGNEKMGMKFVKSKILLS